MGVIVFGKKHREEFREEEVRKLSDEEAAAATRETETDDSFADPNESLESEEESLEEGEKD